MSIVREHVVKLATRSRGWRKTRKEHIARNPYCAACGRKNSLEVHHVRDFSKFPDMELDPYNLMTLCDKGTRCHFTFGHLGNWKSINPDIAEDAVWFRGKVLNRRK